VRTLRRLGAPLAAGLVAAGVAFGAVALATDEAASEPAPVRADAAPHSGRQLFARMGCGSCHTLAAAGSRGELGPSLDDRLPAHTRESLTATILAPGESNVMPRNFAARMSEEELRSLVDFLLAARSRPVTAGTQP
jgi:mono/diheme cytochrome c family protein